MDNQPPVSSAGTGPDKFTLEEAASLTGLPPKLIVQYSEIRCVRVVESGEAESPCFDEAGILRLRQIEHLRIHHGIDDPSLPFVLRLFDRLEAAERELQKLRELLR